MLIDFNEFKRQFEDNIDRLKNIINIYDSAPKKLQGNAGHLGSLITLFPYIYHTALVKKFSPDRKTKILDWGSFLGQVTYLLQDEYEVNAYNPINNEEIEYWQNKLKIKTRLFDQGLSRFKLEFKPNSFDAVISSGVLEHSFERGVTDIDALKNLNKILKPEGLLYIWNLPTKNALAEKIAIARQKWKHVVRYDLDEILVKLNLTGYEIVAIERSELLFYKLAKIFKIVPLSWLWKLDYQLTQFFLFRPLAHHFTIVARKVANFPLKPTVSAYTAYA